MSFVKPWPKGKIIKMINRYKAKKKNTCVSANML